MAVKILTSNFKNGFPNEVAARMNALIADRKSFVFIASEFYKSSDKNDRYFNAVLKMFSDIDIRFDHAFLIDGRLPKERAQKIIDIADVIWLAGGDTPNQFQSLKDFDLTNRLKTSDAVIIGMSAGAINMGKTAVCSITCGHDYYTAYEALGLVNISIEPHFDAEIVSQELLSISEKYPLIGLCDDSAIIVDCEKYERIGDVFWLENQTVTPIFDVSLVFDNKIKFEPNKTPLI